MIVTILSYWAAICFGATLGWILHSVMSSKGFQDGYEYRIREEEERGL